MPMRNTRHLWISWSPTQILHILTQHPRLVW
jgi:hypothetical protein